MTPYDELTAYTLSLRDAAFTHQHVVDAHAAQTADATTKPIAIVFALVGLYLHVERGLSGKDVQRVHMKLARRKQTWPPIALPRDRGSIDAECVLAAPDRIKAVDQWCASVWAPYRDQNRSTIVRLLAHDSQA